MSSSILTATLLAKLQDSNLDATAESINGNTEQRKALGLDTCRSAADVRAKLLLYKRLSKGRLPQFYDQGVHLFAVQNYQLRLQPGLWENNGGIELCIYDFQKQMVQAGGEVLEYTQIKSIHGSSGSKESIEQFRSSLQIHPANLALLLFLKMSQVLKHDCVTIGAFASPEYNYGLMEYTDSPLYMIPRNYFRLKVNPETGLYELDGNKRDALLDKFSKKNEHVARALVSMEDLWDTINL